MRQNHNFSDCRLTVHTECSGSINSTQRHLMLSEEESLFGLKHVNADTQHGGEHVDADTLHGGEHVDADTLHGGEHVDADTLHGCEHVDADTLHGGEHVDADTLHGGEHVDADTLHGGEHVSADTLHGGEHVDADTLHGGEHVDADTLHGGEHVDADTLHGGEHVDADTLHNWSTHHSKSGRIYKYAFVKRSDGHIDIAIQTPPSGRDESLHIVHKLPLEGNASGVRKICIKRPETVKNFDKAEGVMKEYVELFDKYISTGITIDVQLAR